MRTVRILHVVGSMDRAGVETWLMHILRTIDRERYHLDFLVHGTRPGAYDEEVRSFHSQVIRCPKPEKVIAYTRNLKRILHAHGPYDVVHSHVHHFSGLVLRIARGVGVPTRIAHSHLDTTGLDSKAGPLRQQYLWVMKYWIRKHATMGLAASSKAAEALWGPDWRGDSRWHVLYCGIDLTPFYHWVDPAAVRAEFGIPGDGSVLGHVGRFEPQKNHGFLVQTMTRVLQRKSNAWLLLVGDGPRRSEIERQAGEAGIHDRVVFAGSRNDVPRLLLGAMDIFLFPSLYEGLGLAAIEAQTAGLPIVISDTVPAEVEVVPGLLTWLSLSQSPVGWAQACLTALSQRRAVSPHEARARMEESPFNIRSSVRHLQSLYAGGAASRSSVGHQEGIGAG